MRWPGKIQWAEKVVFGTRIKRRRRKMVLLKTKGLYSLPPLPWGIPWSHKDVGIQRHGVL